MTRANLTELTVAELVERFTNVALAQDIALLRSDIRKVNRLFDDLDRIKKALIERPGDQRKALLSLHMHPNPHVRLSAARATLPIARAASRKVLEILNDRNEFPQAANAMEIMIAMDEGRM